jgi:hypothetical protein
MTLMTLSMCAGVDMRFRGRFPPTPAGALVVQRTGQGKAMGGKRHRLAPSAGRTARFFLERIFIDRNSPKDTAS